MEEYKDIKIPTDITIQQELDKLNAILADRLTFDPFSVDDDTLWRIVSSREHSTFHNYHCIVVRFGETYEVVPPQPYKPYKRIKISYANKVGSKKWNDFGFGIIHPNREKKLFNILLDPYYRWSGHRTVLLNTNKEELLPNKQFFLILSTLGKNKFNQPKFAWVMVKLSEYLPENVKIIREYTLIAELWAYKRILTQPHDLGLSIPEKELGNILNPLIESRKSMLEEKSKEFIKRHDVYDDEELRQMAEEDAERHRQEDDYQEELDYIRQNGGDWIDD